MLGHHYLSWRSERVHWLPGWPDPGEVWMESRRMRHRVEGTYCLPSRPPGGMGYVRVAARIWSFTSHTIRHANTVGERMGSGLTGHLVGEDGIERVLWSFYDQGGRLQWIWSVWRIRPSWLVADWGALLHEGIEDSYDRLLLQRGVEPLPTSAATLPVWVWWPVTRFPMS